MKYPVDIATYQDAAKELGNVLQKQPVNVVVRLGGTLSYALHDVQINSSQAIKNSIDKLVQKNLLLGAGLQTLPLLKKPVYPCVIKGRIRSCGTKVFAINNKEEFDTAFAKLNGDCYIEPLFVATSEYRFHCTRDEVFFEVKKIKRNPNDIIINHDNHYNKREFLKPRLYKEIKAECLKAMAALDLDIACFDVMYSSTDNNKHQFAIAEANTNPELLKNTFQAYKEALTDLIEQKVKAIPVKEKMPMEEQQKVGRLQRKVLTEQQKMQIIRDLMNDNFLVDADDGFVNFKL